MKEVYIGLNSLGKIMMIISGLSISLVIPIIWFEAAPTLILIPTSVYLLLIGGWAYSRIRGAVLDRITVHREFDEVVEEGSLVEVRISLRNDTGFGIYPLSILDQSPQTAVLVEGSNKHTIYLPPKSEAVIRYKIRVLGVGRHEFGDLYLFTNDLIGAYTIEGVVKNLGKHITCIPLPSERIINYSEANKLLASGLKTTGESGYSYEFKDIREYVPGDDTRHIDWKSTARLGKLMIREEYMETETDIVIVINLTRATLAGRLGRRSYDYISRVAMELVLTQLNTYNRVGIVLTGLYTNVYPLTRVTVDTIPHFARFLGSIPVYLDTKEGYTTNLDVVTRGIGVRGKTLYIFISDLAGRGEAETILSLSRIGHSIMVINPVQKLFDISEMDELEKILYLASTYDVEKTREMNTSKLVSHGIPVIEAGPETMLITILNKLEEFKRLTPT